MDFARTEFSSGCPALLAQIKPQTLSTDLVR